MFMDILIKVYISSYTVYIVAFPKQIVTNAVIYKDNFILQKYNQYFIMHLQSKVLGTIMKNTILRF